MTSAKLVIYFYVSYVAISAIAIVFDWCVRKRFYHLLESYNNRNESYVDSYYAGRTVLKDYNINDVKYVVGESNQCAVFGSSGRCEITFTDNIAGKKSAAAIAVAAHEAGHAVQYLGGRDELIKKRDESANASVVLILAGSLSPLLCLAFNSAAPMVVGVVLIGYILANRIMYVKVEHEASDIGLKAIIDHKLVSKDDIPKVEKILSAAASTYVSACISSVAGVMSNMLKALG